MRYLQYYEKIFPCGKKGFSVRSLAHLHIGVCENKYFYVRVVQLHGKIHLPVRLG
jgi:lipoate-protein ligase B